MSFTFSQGYPLSLIRYFYYLLLNIILFSASAQANMTVYPMLVDVGQKGTAQIAIQSHSTDVQYIKISVMKIINPATPDEKEIPVEQFGEETLLVTPQKLVLTAGSERIVRLVMLKPLPQESTWRVYFEGVSENAFDESLPVTGGPGQAQVGVNIIWGALVHVPPKNVNIAMNYIPSTDLVVNSGTLRIPLTEIGICSNNNQCEWRKETTTIYPGTKLPLSSIRFNPEKKYKIKYLNWITHKTEQTDLPAFAGY